MAGILQNVVAERSPVRRAALGIQRLIREHNWSEGDRLPSEHALSELFEVSRSTLRKALDDLSQQGIVRRERHRGCVVAKRLRPPSTLASRALVVISDFREMPLPHVSESSSAGVKAGLIETADRLGYSALLIPASSMDAVAVQQLIETRPPGLVLLCWHSCSPATRQVVATLQKTSIPVAAFGMDDIPEAATKFDQVASSHAAGTRDLMNLLVKRGRKRILRAWNATPDRPWIAAHNCSYEATAKALGVAILPPIYVTKLPERLAVDRGVFDERTRLYAGYLAEHLAGEQPVDAIMVGSDSETFNVAAACRLLGRQPGVDVSIVGYDNYWQTAFERQFESAVPFATVDKRNSVIGAELIRLLDERITGKLTGTPQVRWIPQQVVKTEVAAGHLELSVA